MRVVHTGVPPNWWESVKQFAKKELGLDLNSALDFDKFSKARGDFEKDWGVDAFLGLAELSLLVEGQGGETYDGRAAANANAGESVVASADAAAPVSDEENESEIPPEETQQHDDVGVGGALRARM